MTDKDGQETVRLKKYVIEKEKEDDIGSTEKPTEAPTEKPTEKPTQEPTQKPTGQPAEPTKVPQTEAPTQKPKPTVTPPAVPTAPATGQPGNNEPQEEMEVTLTTNKKSSQVKGTKITVSAKVKGGSGQYTYSFMVEDASGKITPLIENSTNSSVTWTPSKAGTYKLLVTVTDTRTSDTESDILSYKITSKKVLKFNSFKASKKKAAAKKKITLTASGTAGTGKVKYKFYYKKKGAKKTTAIRGYSTKNKITWKTPSKKGTYYVYCKIKDGSKKTLMKKVTIKVTKK